MVIPDVHLPCFAGFFVTRAGVVPAQMSSGRDFIMADGDNLVVGATNDSNLPTGLDRTGATPWTALLVTNANGSAVEAQAAAGGTGVAGTSSSGVGVLGRADSGDGVQGRATGGCGVYGASENYISVCGVSPGWLGVGGYTAEGRGVIGGATGSGDAVVGYANAGNGVTGMSQRTHGVQGYCVGGPGAVGVRGDAARGIGVSGTGDWGVVGVSTGSGAGVMASARTDAVVATSNSARGVVGSTLSSTGSGVHGIANPAGPGTGHVGLRGTSSRGFGLLASTSTGVAGGFIGSVVVIGNFTAIGGVKSAAVPHPDGSHRLTYALESPETWFEDFGRARLASGRAEVRLDPDFAALVRTDDFHVFLTAEGESPGLFVAERNEAGFEVREQRGGEGDIPFSYRVVARRRDVDARRLATFDIPEFPSEPEAALVPPELPKVTAPIPPDWPRLPWEIRTEA